MCFNQADADFLVDVMDYDMSCPHWAVKASVAIAYSTRCRTGSCKFNLKGLALMDRL